MIDPTLLDQLLRCPMDAESRLREEGDALVCTRCGLRFAVRDGFPNLVVEEAELPPGCGSLAQLPCQRGAGGAT
jgi:uncharacterized protein YbaR (Trm112 family)